MARTARQSPSCGSSRKSWASVWDWLIEGVGDAPADGVARRDTDDGQAQIPERDIRVAAGPGQIVSEEETRRTWGMPQSFLQALSLRPEALQLVEIVGNSMYPLLWPGDIVLIDRRSVTPDLGAVYALWDGDATVCKWVSLQRSGKSPMYLISSENSAEHQSYTRRPEDVTIIGRVVWFGRRL